MKTFNDAITFANQNPFCFVATIDGDKPAVRSMKMLLADETGFYFASPKKKNIIRQLKVNPNIEACFLKWGNVLLENAMLRISGSVKFLNDKNLFRKDDIVENSQKLIIFKIVVGEVSVWKESDGWTSSAKTLFFDISDSIKKAQVRNRDENVFLSFKEKDCDYYLDKANIIYLSSRKKITIIHTENRDYEVKILLKNIESKLTDERFLRIQKQYIINLDYIDRIEYLEGGRYLAYLNDNDDTILPVGRNYVAALKDKIANNVSFIS